MKRRSVICARALLSVLVLIVTAACETDRVIPLYSEGFEVLCEGTPCGWMRSVGTPDQATWVETVHPGEHALRLTGEVTVRGPGSDAASRVSSTLTLQITVRCDLGSSLTADIVINDATGSRPYTHRVVTQQNWTQDICWFNTDGGPRIVAIVLTKRGTGVCEIANIMIDDQFFIDSAC